jgi:hypothetical protein
VCDKEATEGLKKYQPVANRQGARHNQHYDKGKGILPRPSNAQKSGRKNTFLPPGSIPVERWMHQGLIKFNKGTMEVGGTSGTKQTHLDEANK